MRRCLPRTSSSILNRSRQIIGYADDLDVVGRTLADLREVYRELTAAADEVGLTVNVGKTKLMTQSRRGRQLAERMVRLGMHDFEVVREFKYLGTKVTAENDGSMEVQERIAAANRAFFSITNIIKSKTVHRNTKLLLYKTLIRPVVMYGSENWSLTKKMADTVDRFERKILRRIFGPVCENDTWRIRNNREIEDLLGEARLSIRVRINRLRWAGHVARMPDTRLPKITLVGQPGGKRPVGKPRTRWTDGVDADSRGLLNTGNWRRAAMARDEWRQKLEEVRARSGL